MKKLKKISALKKLVWRYFSEFIRRRDEKDGCISCLVKIPWEEAHAGHYIHGHSKSSFLSEANSNLQCPRCNHFLSGNLLAYHEAMLKKYGEEKIAEIKQLSKQIWKPSRQELEDLIYTYKKRVEFL